MSRTFKAILKHWIGDPTKQGVDCGLNNGTKRIDLPFNLELFCQEMDEELLMSDEIKVMMKQHETANFAAEDFKPRTDLELCVEDIQDFNIAELNELSAEIRKARKRLKYDDRAKELAK